MTSQRWQEVDATRGVAMGFVCLSHFATAYFEKNGAQQLAHWSYVVSQIASPTFMLVSGMMLGLLYQKHRSEFAVLQRKFVGRGLYLLTLVHVVLLVPHIVLEQSLEGGFRWMFITDTIGVSMILGALLIDRMPMRSRLLFSLAVYAFSTGIAFFWNPPGYYALAVKDVLFGEDYSHGFFREFFAIVPWFSYYFAATVLGQSLAEAGEGRSKLAHFQSYLWRVSLVLLVGGGVVFVARHAIRDFGFECLHADLTALTSVVVKRPPSPMYFIVHGGAALAILVSFVTFRRVLSFSRWPTSLFALHGRVSLFTYVLHYYLYFGVIGTLNIPLSPWWPLLFAGSLAVLSFFAYYWDKWDLNSRFVIPSLTVSRREREILNTA